jgi:hypothetical protein
MRAAAIAVLVLVLAVPAATGQPRRATLELERLVPLVVAGHAFGQGERVVLTASAPTAQKKMSVVARRNGSFTARFGLQLRRCAPFTVRAVGLLGSRAILQVEPGCAKKRRGPE